MHPLVEGQRWFSKTEPELGVGTLVEINDRTICIRFDSRDCIRQYTLEAAPLKRLVFKPGDNIQLKNNSSLIIEIVSESGGLLYYAGKNQVVCEKDLSDSSQTAYDLQGKKGIGCCPGVIGPSVVYRIIPEIQSFFHDF